MRKECRNEIRAETIWENRKWNKISLSQHRIVALLQNFHDFSMPNHFLEVTVSYKRFWFSSVPSEMCNCSASTLLQQLAGKTYCSAAALGPAVHCSIASFIDTWLEQLPHGPVWVHVSLASHLWGYSLTLPRNPYCGFGGHRYNEGIWQSHWAPP